MATTINWLHLTDLHLGMRGATDFWPTIERDFFKDVRFLIETYGPLDLVIFTGDLVQTGATEEYEELDRLLKRFWQKFQTFGCEPKFLAIPGNHDLCRPPADDPAIAELSRVWNERPNNNPLLEDPESSVRKLLDQAFANYQSWWLDSARSNIPNRYKPQTFSRGLLPGDFSATLEKDGIQLGVVGLNSTFLQLTAGDMMGKLGLHVRQFHQACEPNGPEWVEKHDACLLLTHHPVDWLTAEAQGYLNGFIHQPPELFALHLFGHMHEARLSSLASGGSHARRRLQGYSLFGMDAAEGVPIHRVHGYSLGQLVFDDVKAPTMRVVVRLAQLQQDGGWTFTADPSLSADRATPGTALFTVSSCRSEIAPPKEPDDERPAQEPAAVAVLPEGRPANNLPRWLETPIGRDDKTAELRDLLLPDASETRLITITGEGGIGKSTLALHVIGSMLAAKELQHFSSGVFHLDFKELIGKDVKRTDLGRDLVANAIADATPNANPRGSSGLRLSDAFKTQRMLLVLDNFELVLSGASLVLELLESCPGIKFLATSQELLANAEDRLRHTERHVRLQPLGLPTLQQLGDLTALRAAPAMRLLIARASKERENFDVTPETAEDLIKICHLTDGLPLAIELVASVVAANDVAAVLSELERDGWDELDRSKKVATALTWRYTALTAEDQQLFRRIAVFAGGFTHDAAKQVFSRMGYPPPTVARLSSLSRQNLLRLDSSAKRYQLLWLVQEYGLQELERSGEAAALRQHHADYFRQFLEQQEPTADSGSRLDWLRRVQQEYGNLKAVMLRSLSDQLDIQTGLAIAGRLFWYWNLKGHFGEGRRMLRNFLDRGAGSDDQRARLLYGEGGLAFLQGDYVFAKKQLAASEELWRRSPERDRRGLAYSLVILGMVRRELNEELEDARANEEESVSIFRAVKDNWGLALALNDLGNVLVADRQYGRGRAQYEESKALWQKLNEQWGLALTLGNLGHLSCLEKEYGTARDFFEDALTIQRKQSDTWGIAWSLKGVGDVAVGQQKFEEAAKNYFESFRMHWAIARRQLISECVEGLGVVARWQAQWERAAQLLAAADNLSCGRKPEHEREAYVNSEKAVRAALGDRFQEAWREGHRWDAEQLLQHVHAYAADLMAPGSPQAAAAIELAPVAAPLPSVRADNVANVERKIGAGEFDVFLCHNSQDKEAVKEIGKQLIKAGLRPWLDEWELRPGLPWMRALEEQISKIRSAAVFVGESGLGPWQDAEREAFIDEFRRRGCPVIPVILSGTEKTPALPLFLKQMTWVDFRKREPDPLRSLIWGITGERT